MAAKCRCFRRVLWGALSEQSTFDRLYEIVVEKFANFPNVEIIRSSTNSARDVLAQQLGESHGLTYVYVDASHQYKDVLQD